MSNIRRLGMETQIAKDGPNISKLMFAKGCLLFCEATKHATRNIKHILDHYSKVSPRLVNCHKSKVQFSEGTDRATKRNCRHSNCTNYQ